MLKKEYTSILNDLSNLSGNKTLVEEAKSMDEFFNKLRDDVTEIHTLNSLDEYFEREEQTIREFINNVKNRMKSLSQKVVECYEYKIKKNRDLASEMKTTMKELNDTLRRNGVPEDELMNERDYDDSDDGPLVKVYRNLIFAEIYSTESFLKNMDKELAIFARHRSLRKILRFGVKHFVYLFLLVLAIGVLLSFVQIYLLGVIVIPIILYVLQIKVVDPYFNKKFFYLHKKHVLQSINELEEARLKLHANMEIAEFSNYINMNTIEYSERWK